MMKSCEALFLQRMKMMFHCVIEISCHIQERFEQIIKFKVLDCKSKIQCNSSKVLHQTFN